MPQSNNTADTCNGYSAAKSPRLSKAIFLVLENAMPNPEFRLDEPVFFDDSEFMQKFTFENLPN